MKKINAIISTIIASVIILTQIPVDLLAANGFCNLNTYVMPGITTAECKCSTNYGSDPGSPLGGGCPPGYYTETWSYTKCVSGSKYSVCDNSPKKIGRKRSCSPVYDDIVLARCAGQVAVCDWVCVWSVLPPNPAQMALCASCLIANGTSCRTCQYLSCSGGDWIDVSGYTHDDTADGVPETNCGG